MSTIESWIIGSIFAILIVIEGAQIKTNRKLQIQIDELRIIVDQKFLPALILDPADIR